MPPKKGKKGKRKGKKKGKKKPMLPPEGPPLHLLTEIYKKLDDATMELYEMRIAMRRKRLETWYMMLQIAESKVNNQIFREYIQGKMNDIQEAIDHFILLIQKERDEINAAIKKICDEYEKMKQDFMAKSEQIEIELEAIRTLLLEFAAMMLELDRLLARLEELKKEIAAAEIEANMKIRHLTNQFLHERGRLHNHLEEQLCMLIKHCRSYILPILWNFMQKLISKNLCSRWKLSRVDEKNIALAEKRDELIRRRKLLTLEKPYWSIEWAIYKMSEDAASSKKKKIIEPPKDIKTTAEMKDLLVGKTDAEMAQLTISGAATTFSAKSGGCLLGRDFNKFLIQRLTAANAAQLRHDKSNKKEKKRFLEIILERSAEERRLTIMGNVRNQSTFYEDGDFDDYHDHEHEHDHDQWDDVEEDNEEEDDDEEEEEEEEEQHAITTAAEILSVEPEKHVTESIENERKKSMHPHPRKSSAK